MFFIGDISTIKFFLEFAKMFFHTLLQQAAFRANSTETGVKVKLSPGFNIYGGMTSRATVSTRHQT
jgi:hypothetical protein